MIPTINGLEPRVVATMIEVVNRLWEQEEGTLATPALQDVLGCKEVYLATRALEQREAIRIYWCDQVEHIQLLKKGIE